MKPMTPSNRKSSVFPLAKIGLVAISVALLGLSLEPAQAQVTVPAGEQTTARQAGALQTGDGGKTEPQLVEGDAAAAILAQQRSRGGGMPAEATESEVVSEPWLPIPGPRTISIDLKQLGAWGSPQLTGVINNRYFTFRLRPDEVVVDARLKLGYDYSPALLPDLSHLLVALNGQNVGLFGMPQGQNLNNQREIPIPPMMFGKLNELMFGFIGHYTRECENPFNSTLWMTLHSQTRLELTVVPADPGINDLSRVAELFAPKGMIEATRIPVVFPTNPTSGSIRAAGVISSWIGMEAQARNVRLEAVRGQLPPTNAIMVLKGGESVAGIAGQGGSEVALVPNPSNPAARVLVISGADDAALMRAARAVALDAKGLTGQRVAITAENMPAERKPYDAPAWIPTDRAVRIGEIVPRQDLNVQNQQMGVIRMNYRVPPDLFAWRTAGVPAEIRYRATQLATLDNSNLNISLNRQALQSISLADHTVIDRTIKQRSNAGKPVPLPSSQLLKPIDGVSLRSLKFRLPAYAIQGRNQMQFNFNFDIRGGGDCENVPLNAMVGSIDGNSWVDFSGFPHYVAMPDLQLFSTMGFPFTRMADLADTAVVLSPAANESELSLYLNAMELMGEVTGYPALRHVVTDTGNVKSVEDKDLLVIGSGTSQPLLSDWNEHLPMTNINGQRRLKEIVTSWRPQYRWEEQDSDTLLSPIGSINLARAGRLSVLMGLESPLKAGRNAVFMYADRPQDLIRLTNVLSDPERWSQVRGDFSLVSASAVETAKVTPTYYMGSLPITSRSKWFFRDQPLGVTIVGILAILALATVGYRRQRKRRN